MLHRTNRSVGLISALLKVSESPGMSKENACKRQRGRALFLSIGGSEKKA
jgi:hypothetical protein